MRIRAGASSWGAAMVLTRSPAASAVQGAIGPRATDRRRVPFAMGGHDGSR